MSTNSSVELGEHFWGFKRSALPLILHRIAQGLNPKGKMAHQGICTNISDSARDVPRNVVLMQFLWGCSYGCYIFVYGALYVGQLRSGKSYVAGLLPAGILLIIRQVLSALLDIPMGILADKFGRLNLVRFAFLAKLLFHGSLASLALVSSWYPSVVGAASSSIFFAVAYTSFSGAFSAWVVNESRESGIDPFTVLAAGHNAFFWGELLTGVASVLLFSWKSPAPFLLGAAFCAIAWIWAVTQCHEHQSSARAALNQVGRVPDMTGRFKERFHVLREVVSTGGSVLAVMIIFGCFMFLLNIVEHFWPVLVNEYRGDVSFGREQVWVVFVLLVCVIRLVGAHLLKNRLNAIKSLPIELKIKQGKPLFLLCGFSAASIAIVSGILAHLGGDYSHTPSRIMAFNLFISLAAVLLLVFIHGIIAPLYDVLINAVMPASLDSNRAAVLSIGTTIRSVLAAIFAGPAAAAIIHWRWSIPGIVLLLATVGVTIFVKRQDLGKNNLKQIGVP